MDKKDLNDNGREDVLNDIEAAINGLKSVERYGLFVQHEDECKEGIQMAIRLLRGMKEVLKG